MSFCHVTSVGHIPTIQIDNIGCSADAQNNRFGPGQRDIWLIHYVTKGKGFFNGHPVIAGQGFLIYRGQAEYYYPDEENPWEFLWITITGDAKSIFERYKCDKRSQIFDYDFVFVIKNIMQFLRNNHRRILTCEQMLEIFLHIFNCHRNSDEKSKYSRDKYVDFSVNYIKTHLHLPIKVHDIADIVGISATYLLKIFKNKLGTSPKQYITDLKLHTSKKLLAESSISITEISNSVGFQDVLVFSRFFSLKTGMSPSEYRRNATKGIDNL